MPDSGPQADPAALLVAQAVLQAVDRAGQSEHWPEQIEQAGLQAWKVEKVFGCAAARQQRGSEPGHGAAVAALRPIAAGRTGRRLA